jgi:hypothetical protein
MRECELALVDPKFGSEWGCCENNNEISSSVKSRELTERLSVLQCSIEFNSESQYLIRLFRGSNPDVTLSMNTTELQL